MNRLLVKFLLESQLDGDVHFPPEPIYRREEGSTYLEPDMMYVSGELREKMGEKRTSADIVFEYLSASTSIYDRTTKADTYLALGARELWLIDPVTVTIEVRHANMRPGSLAWEILKYKKGRPEQSRVLEGWTVSVDGLFEGLA
jgi:Uma2 family endonuclease